MAIANTARFRTQQRVSTKFEHHQSWIGLVFGLGVLSATVLLTGGDLLRYLHFPSLVLVLGGTLGAGIVHFSLSDLRHALTTLLKTTRTRSTIVAERMGYLVSLAQAVRREGRVQVLEREAKTRRDPFLCFALETAVDGHSAQELRQILETETRIGRERWHNAVQVFETLGSYAPAFGLIGTVLGLIAMLDILQSAQSVGPAMSTALVTTLYGAVAAHLFFLPIAGKLRLRGEREERVKALTIEAMASIIKEENPLVLEQRLQSFALGGA